MNFFKDRRSVALAGAGAGVALVAGLGIAAFVMTSAPASPRARPASQGGLVVETGRDEDVKLDERRPLRCFVDGKLVGDLPLSDCAHRNGVATGALDVGLDASGALAASNGVGAQITPLPPMVSPPPARPAAGDGGSTRVAACWRYGDGEWERFPDDLPLSTCLRTLYGGECRGAGEPIYGRWADRTLRLLEGRVEISADNRNFRTLGDRNPGCIEGERG
jgi:hypothetical protein